MSKKNNNNKNKPANKPDAKVEEIKAEKPKGKTYKVKKDLGFATGKRNYFINNKNCLIVQGAEVDEDFYNQFNDREKKIFFEN